MKKQKEIAKLWHNGEMPARLFFEILTTSNLKLLKITDGKAKKKELKRNWTKIYDEYFVLKNDPKLALIVKTQVDIAKLVRMIEVTRQALYAIVTVQFDNNQIKILADKITEQGFYFDVENIIDSVHNILHNEIPSIETSIEILKDNLKDLTEGVSSTFEESCVACEGWGYKIDENCSLRRYVAYEKAVKSKANKQKSNGKR
jgi:hypothetical protein